MRRTHLLLADLARVFLVAGVVLAAARGTAAGAPPRYTLKAAQRWLLRSPDGQRFDASGLARLPDGTLVAVNDKALPPCRVVPGTNGVARLVPMTNLFAREAVVAAAGSLRTAPDCEGLAVDDRGRVYLCEEGTRSIFRTVPGGPVEKLAIDWAPVRQWFDPRDGNASFEGVAVGGNTLYVANERSKGRIIEVDLGTLRVTGDFRVTPAGSTAADTSYSDLAWWRGELWVLCREDRCVLRVSPATRAVVAEYDYAAVENAPENAYVNPLPYGFVEGLSVDDGSIWLAVDNNGLPRRMAPTDTRGLLFRCARPDAGAGAGAADGGGASKRNGAPGKTGTP